jgi:hypothetical protein
VVYVFGATGDLEASEFVPGLIEVSLYRGLVAGELGEGVRLVGIPDKRSAERCRFGVFLAFISQAFERAS